MEALDEMLKLMTQEIGTEIYSMGSKSAKTHGESTKNDDVCTKCNNSGWEIYIKDGLEYARECSCGIRKHQIMESRLQFASIPEAYKDVSFHTFKFDVYKKAESRNIISQACRAVKYWTDNYEAMCDRGMGLYLFSGTKGSGKTRMAASIANKIIKERNVQVKFATSIQIINEIKKSWKAKDKEESESKLLYYLSTADVLVIDDFGTEKLQPWINEKFYHIINTRYAEKKITIFTSNMCLDDLKYDDRITSRIKERSFQVPFPEESVRELIKKENEAEWKQKSI